MGTVVSDNVGGSANVTGGATGKVSGAVTGGVATSDTVELRRPPPQLGRRERATPRKRLEHRTTRRIEPDCICTCNQWCRVFPVHHATFALFPSQMNLDCCVSCSCLVLLS